MPGTLILVESPNKARKIQEYLGRGFTVRASMGHICDLPQRDYGVDLATFEERYEVRDAALVRDLRALVGRFERILLASDPDREGEAIAWHLARELKLPAGAPQRIEFREITPAALERALASPRPVNLDRVDAQRSRRVLDRIIGWDVSQELCWPAGARSAGRVQTPALHLLCERERQILAFEAAVYWTVGAVYVEGLSAFVPAEAETEAGGEAAGDTAAGEGQRGGRLQPKRFGTREEAEATVAAATPHPHVVQDVARRRVTRRPEPPYTTSTMQQDASRKLRLSARQAAELAQRLFEAGYITYHRTDSTRLSDEAVAMARVHIAAHRPDVLPDAPPKSRVKAGAQDAHEAIRPTRLADDDAPPAGTAELYRMIKARFLASQSKPAAFERTTVTIQAGPVTFVAEGSVLLEEGFLAYWRPYARQEDTVIPAVAVGQTLGVTAYEVEEKKTTPPSRYDTGGLIRKLETSGIGRPSTFAAIVDTLLAREYVQEIAAGRGKRFLQPTDLGMRLDELLTAAMPPLVSEEYTAAMESELDRIESGGDPGRRAWLEAWYRDFRAALGESLPRAAAYREAHGLRPAWRAGRGGGQGEETKITCDRCGDAAYRKVARKKGKGSFLACPACGMTRDVRAATKPGGCPKCGSTLVERRRKDRSKFFGCARYGAAERPCDYIDGGGERKFRREETDKPCPKCGKATLALLHPRESAGTGAGTGASAPFYACADRTCKFTLPFGARRRKEPCPRCGGLVLERHRKPTAEQKARGESGESFWACAKYPGCRYAADLPARPA